MPLLCDTPLTWAQRLSISILRAGRMPKHIAFIMDGNRRHARNINVSTYELQQLGFKKLTEVIQWGTALGITELSFFAFSIDNFKRSKEEVDIIMRVTQEKFELMIEEKDKMMEHGICVRVLGNLSQINPELRKLMTKAMLLFRNNTKCFINIIFVYTSQHEITNSMKCINEGVKSGLLEVTDIDENLISNCMYTNICQDVDIIVRTSGEARLSNFLLWQTPATQISFVNVLWPIFSFWQFLGVIFKYQRYYDEMMEVQKTKKLLSNQCAQNKPRVAKFIDLLNQSRRKEVEKYANS